MNKHRELVILEKLQKDQVCTINQLSLLCDASYKTIQSDIKHLNDRFYRHHFHSRIERQRGVGVAIVDEDHHELEVIMTELLAQSNDMQVQDKETMALKIALMLFQHSYLKIDDLCDTLCLSRSVVNEIVILMRSMLKRWEIHVASKPHYGLYLEGLERDMRRFLFENFVLKQELQSAVNSLGEVTIAAHKIVEMFMQPLISIYLAGCVLHKDQQCLLLPGDFVYLSKWSAGTGEWKRSYYFKLYRNGS